MTISNEQSLIGLSDQQINNARLLWLFLNFYVNSYELADDPIPAMFDGKYPELV